MSSSADGSAAPGAPAVDIVPLGGLGEFGLNMMAISCGETTIVIDAGAMFPEPDLLGVDLIIPDLAYLEARRGQVKALILTHGHEDHIGAVPYVAAARGRTDLRHAAGAGVRRTQARGARHRARARPEGGQAARRGHHRPVPDRVHPRHAQHARLRGDRHPDAAGRADPHGRFQDRPDAARRRTVRPAPLRPARRAKACSRCSATARTSIGAATPARRWTSRMPSRRSSPAPRARSSSRRSRRASTGCRSSPTSPCSSIARWRSSAAG